MVEPVSRTRLTPAVLRSLDILELFLDHHDGLTGAEVARLTGHPRASVHELLATLVARGYLSRAGQTYRLGVCTLQLGNAYRESIRLPELARRVATDLVAECGETINVGVLSGRDVVYLVKVDSPHPVRMVSSPGGRVAAAGTSVGKMLLASVEPAELDVLLAAGWPALTTRTITDPDELRAQLAAARRDGIAHESGESTPEVSCAAAPVRDDTGRVVAAISVAVPDSRWEQRPTAYWDQVVREGAAALSELLGHPGRGRPAQAVPPATGGCGG